MEEKNQIMKRINALPWELRITALIILTFNKKLSQGKTLILSASLPEKGGKIIWDCKGGTLDLAYRFIEYRPWLNIKKFISEIKSRNN